MGTDSSSFDEVTRSRTIVGVRTTNSNLAVCREPIARCLVRAAQSQKGRSIWSRRTLLLRVVKNGRTQSEHMSSGLPPRADIVRCGPHVANVATTGLMRRSKLVAGKPLKCELPFARPRQYDFELGEKPLAPSRPYAASVLFYDDVVAHRQAMSGTFARGFRCEERVEYFLFDLFRDVVPLSRIRISTLSPRFFVVAKSVGSKPSPASFRSGSMRPIGPGHRSRG
jgi:hypothetical protein